MTDPVPDLLPAVAAELAADADLTALTAERIRVGEFAPGDGDRPFRAVVVLIDYGAARLRPRVPVQQQRFLAKCYGATDLEAGLVLGHVRRILHRLEPRLNEYREILHQSREDVGQGADRDPITDQPFRSEVFIATGSTQLYVS